MLENLKEAGRHLERGLGVRGKACQKGGATCSAAVAMH